LKKSNSSEEKYRTLTENLCFFSYGETEYENDPVTQEIRDVLKRLLTMDKKLESLCFESIDLESIEIVEAKTTKKNDELKDMAT
jgi:hypothetical protein